MDAETRFRALFVTAYPALHRYAHNRGLTAEDAQDLVAATLEVAWRRLDEVPDDEPLLWLYGVARNVGRNRLRALRRQERLMARLASRGALRRPQDSDRSEADALRQALATLDPADQEILRLIAWDGLTPAQAAIVLGCSAVAARSRLHRARNRLAARLGFSRDRQRTSLVGQIHSGQIERITTLEASDD